MQLPSNEMIYDSLAQLMQEKKIYQTAKGYFIVTPEYVLKTIEFFFLEFSLIFRYESGFKMN